MTFVVFLFIKAGQFLSVILDQAIPAIVIINGLDILGYQGEIRQIVSPSELNRR